MEYFYNSKKTNNSNISSLSKKTGTFEENAVMVIVKMNSFSTKSPNNLHFSIGITKKSILLIYTTFN